MQSLCSPLPKMPEEDTVQVINDDLDALRKCMVTYGVLSNKWIDMLEKISNKWSEKLIRLKNSPEKNG